MLKEIFISNFAIIENISIEFPKNLTIITGETGAGKSIIVGALSILMGERFDNNLFFDNTKKSIIEAIYDITKYNLNNFFEENNIDYDDNLIIRREFHNNGKSRNFINDTPVNLNTIKKLSSFLIDIHSQHHNLLLNETMFRINLIDNYASTTQLFNDYKKEFAHYQKLKKQLNELTIKSNEERNRQDYIQFLYNELCELNIQENEAENIEKELDSLFHIEEIKSNLSNIITLLNETENNVISSLANILQLINNISKYNPLIDTLKNRIQSSYIEIKDILHELLIINNNTSYDSDRINILNARFEQINNFFRKHKVNRTSDLIKIKQDLEKEIDSISNIEDKISQINQEIISLEKELHNKATLISQQRNNSINKLQKEITEILMLLGIPDAQFILKNDISHTLLNTGYDKINILFSANKGSTPQDISQVASGGEISRLMLALKSVITSTNILPTIIFDEIDTGVSGEIADKIGNLLKQMSKSRQIIAITHLPQIAAYADYHLKVFKEKSSSKTITKIKHLDKEQRIQEIAKMLSGEKISGAAIENAKNLLNIP